MNRRTALQLVRFEDRLVPASINAQYVVELQTHEVAIGFDHLSLLITPADPTLFTDEDDDDRADQDPLFVQRSDGGFALSIGAGPVSDILVSDFNRERDIAIHPSNERFVLAKPAIYSDSRAWVNALINKSAGYSDALEYDLFPGLTGDYNSNSFIAGILNATGTTIVDPSTIFLDGDYPGYSSPVPSSAFAAKPVRRIDLVFAIDTTGSMFDDIDAVKAAAADIISEVHDQFKVDGLVDTRIAVTDYRDFPTSPYGVAGDYPFFVDLKFTSSAAAANAGIQSLSLGNGGDFPESVFSGLMGAIQSPTTGSWRGEGVGKIIIVMGDAPGHDPEPFTGYTIDDVITAAENEDPVIIFPVVIGSSAGTGFSEIAEGTGGQVFESANASEVVPALLAAIGAIADTPVAEANGPYIGFVGTPITLTSVGSFDPDGTIVQYEWDFDANGTYDATTTAPTIEHTWISPYAGRVRLRVTDNDGLTNFDIADATITEAPAITSGTTFLDLNADGVKQPGEPGLAGRTVYFDQNGNGKLDPGEPKADSAADGSFTVDGIGSLSHLLFPGDRPTGNSLALRSFGAAAIVESLPGPISPSGTAEADFIRALYRRILGRDAQAFEVAYWTELDLDPGALVDGFWNSLEHRRQQVAGYYRDFLGRAPDAEGLNRWVEVMQAGVSEERVVAGFLLSPEFEALNPTPVEYIGALFGSLFGRERNGTEGPLLESQLADAGGKANVVESFLQSLESKQRAVNGFYVGILDRVGESGGVATWTSAIDSIGLAGVAKQFFLSAEFGSKIAPGA